MSTRFSKKPKHEVKIFKCSNCNKIIEEDKTKCKECISKRSDRLDYYGFEEKLLERKKCSVFGCNRICDSKVTPTCYNCFLVYKNRYDYEF